MKSLRNYQGWGIRVAVIAGAALWLALVAASWADAAESKDDEYNFNWLDPEKKIYVLQNRRYTKADRIMVSVMGGPGFSNSYRSTYNLDPRLAYYVNEQFGFEVFYTATFNSENAMFQSLVESGTPVFPVIREIKGQLGALLHWSPWYAKINVFNKILYFDWYFSAGAGQVQAQTNYSRTQTGAMTSEQFFSGYVGTGHQYHLSDKILVRLDVTGAFFKAPTKEIGGNTAWFPNYNFGIGLGVRL